MAAVAQPEVEPARALDELYDFAVRVTRDHDAATRVVLSVVDSMDEADAESATSLYRVARDVALEQLPDAPSLAVDDGVFVQEADDDDGFAYAVWAAAAAFSARDYALLDTHVRRGVAAAELDPRATILARTLEDVIFATALMAEHDCRGLQSVIDASGGPKPTRDLVRAVNRHAGDCRRCSETKRLFPAPLDVFAALPLVEAPPRLREAVAAVHRREPPTRSLVRRAVAGVGGALAVVALTVAGVFLLRTETAAAPPKLYAPSDVRSASHKLTIPSRKRVIKIRWSPRPGTTGYSISWTRMAADPDSKVDLAASTDVASSRRLAKGEWWFNLRARDARGGWTNTIHLGPFVIKVPARKRAKPKPAAPVVQATPTPTFVPTPTPPAQPAQPKPTSEPVATQPTPEPPPPPTQPPPTQPPPTQPPPTEPPPTPTEPPPPLPPPP